MIAFSETEIEVATRLLKRLTEQRLVPSPGTEAHSRAPEARRALVAKASKMLKDRARRHEFVPIDGFGEPPWDVLLVLYVSDLPGVKLTIGMLADLARTPHSSVHRWVQYLEMRGIVGRLPDDFDARRIFIQLLQPGRDMLDAYFATV